MKSFPMEFVKIPNFFQFYPRKRVSRNIFGLTLRIDVASPIYFEQIVSFCAIIFSNANSW